jgi:hypothetical protein
MFGSPQSSSKSKKCQRIILVSLGFCLPVYLDPSRPIPERIQDLLDNMTLEEKVGQMMQVFGASGE